MPPEYPWYSVADGPDPIEQGDLLRNFPVLVPASSAILADSGEPEIEAEIQYFNVLIMTHSCDLANDKVDHIVLCPHVDLEKAQDGDEDLKGKNIAKEIQKGKFLKYQLLAPSGTEIMMPIQVLDFGRVVSMPKRLVALFAQRSGRRLRLLPPYREHIAQSFARCYMRVALPKLPLDVLSPTSPSPATPSIPPGLPLRD